MRSFLRKAYRIWEISGEHDLEPLGSIAWLCRETTMGLSAVGSLRSDAFERRTSTGCELFFSFNMPWRHQIYIAKCLYSYRDNLPTNLFQITAEGYKKSTSSWRRGSKTAVLLKRPSLLLNIVTKLNINSHAVCHKSHSICSDVLSPVYKEGG